MKIDKDRQPLLSVCIPTYNRATMLADAIESALAQDFKDFELVVCDNASTDDTEAVVKRYEDPRVRYHRFPELVGMYANHNRCIGLARAPWIVFLHSDDRLAPSGLSAMARAAERAPGRTGVIVSTHDRESLRALRQRPWCKDVIHFPHTCVIMVNGIGSPSVVGFSAEALKEVNGFSEDEEIAYCADHDICTRIASAKWSCCFIDERVECRGVGDHQATNHFLSTGKAAICLANVFKRMSHRASYRETIDFLRTDIAEWPVHEQSLPLFYLSIAGLKDDYRSLWRILRGNEELRKIPRVRRARLADFIGATLFLKLGAWSKPIRNRLRRLR